MALALSGTPRARDRIDQPCSAVYDLAEAMKYPRVLALRQLSPQERRRLLVWWVLVTAGFVIWIWASEPLSDLGVLLFIASSFVPVVPEDRFAWNMELSGREFGAVLLGSVACAWGLAFLVAVAWDDLPTAPPSTLEAAYAALGSPAFKAGLFC